MAYPLYLNYSACKMKAMKIYYPLFLEVELF